MNAATSFRRSAAVLMLGGVLALSAAAEQPVFSPPRVLLSDRAAPKPSSAVCGFALIAGKSGPQAAIMGPDMLTSIRAGENVEKSCQLCAFKCATLPLAVSWQTGVKTASGDHF